MKIFFSDTERSREGVQGLTRSSGAEDEENAAGDCDFGGPWRWAGHDGGVRWVTLPAGHRGEVTNGSLYGRGQRGYGPQEVMHSAG